MIENDVAIQCIEISQPIGRFYVGSINYKDLLEISYTDMIRIDESDINKFLGIERPLSKSREDEIGQYTNTVDATFPSSIIVSILSESAVFDSQTNTMRIKRARDTAKIIDGQHRLAGLRHFNGELFDLIITVFIDMSLEDQAMVFSTINLEQTKVSKSIVYSLYEYTKNRSPQKSCHDIAKVLNSTADSPLYHKIKILGRATKGIETETLTQATFVEALLPLISSDPIGDKDCIKRNKHLIRVAKEDERRLIFRNLFIDDNDTVIAETLWDYFGAVNFKWPNAWQQVQQGYILNKTTGFSALMRFLPLAYCQIKDNYERVDKEHYARLFEKVTVRDDELTLDNYPAGSVGQIKLFQKLRSDTGI